MVKVYSRIEWVNKKDGQTTPLGATNLNKMDAAINEMDNNIVELDTLKADKETVNTMLADCEYDEKTGIVKLTRKNGEQIVFDLNIEKIPVAFELSKSGVLTMTTDDGTEWTADIASMIPVLTFNNSDTINVIVTGTGNNKTYTFEVKDGSITGDKLQPNYLADIKVESLNASASADRAYESEQSAAESARNIQEHLYLLDNIEEKIPTIMTGATESDAGTSGLAPAPEAGDNEKFLSGDGTWKSAPTAVEPVNNLLATVPGTALDAVQGKVLNDKIANLGGFTPVIDETTGQITGYTTEIGGADTVFPFKSGENMVFALLTQSKGKVNSTTVTNFGYMTNDDDGKYFGNFIKLSYLEFTFLSDGDYIIYSSKSTSTTNGSIQLNSKVIYKYSNLPNGKIISVKKGDTLRLAGVDTGTNRLAFINVLVYPA